MLALAAPAYPVDLANGIVLDLPPEKVEEELGKLPPSRLSPQDKIDMANYRFTGDTLKVIAIPVEWLNRPATYSRETLDSLLFSRNVFPGGSVADYYHEISYGQLTIVGEVLDWYNAGMYNGDYYFEPVFDDLDPVIDYTQFDGDYDGNVDAAVFIRSGTGEEDSQDPWDIWSYAYIYPLDEGPGPYDGGMHIPRWNTSPEMRPLRLPGCPPPFSGEDTLNRIRVFCHELAHNVGLPDLYDYDDKLDISTYNTPGDYNDHPMMDWCVMGYYGYGLFSLGSDIPSHMCGWSKQSLGWIEPIMLYQGTHNSLTIYNLETTNDSSLYLIPIDPNEGEYFLLEYRNPNSSAQYDKVDSDFSVYLCPDLSFGCDPLDQGLLITHVHDSLVSEHRINYGTPTYPHYSVAVEDAGYNPSYEGWPIFEGSQWYYPYETRLAAPFSQDVPDQEFFGPTTTPSSDGYSGPTGIIVEVIDIDDDKLYANVYNPNYSGASVIDVEPDQNQANVPASTNITVTFDRYMDGATVRDSSVMITGSYSGIHNATVTYDNGSKTLTADPDDDFTVGEEVAVTLTTDMESALSIPFEGYSWSFTVGTPGGFGMFSPSVAYSTSQAPAAVTAADFDGDGDLDLATSNWISEDVSVLLNNGDGSYAPHSDYFAGPEAGSLCAADIDGDEDIDLIVANNTWDPGTVYIIKGNGDGTFQPSVGWPVDQDPASVIAADFDSDGDMDLATANMTGGTVSILLNNGTGAFPSHVEYSTDWTPWVVHAADLDKNGDLDLVTANFDPASVSILMGNGDGTFAAHVDYATGSGPSAVVAADINADTHLDLVVADGFGNDIAVLLNQSDGVFDPYIGYSIGSGDTPGCICAADFDGDGDIDVATPNIGSDDVSVLLNNGAGVFTFDDVYPVGSEPYWIIAADVDGDTDFDLVTADHNSDGVSVLLNEMLYLEGDANGSGGVDIDDPVFLIAYIFSGGPPPDPLESGDATDCIGDVDIDDVVHLIAYIFSEGPAPCEE
jgi:M6 family metalloprotease-like protein